MIEKLVQQLKNQFNITFADEKLLLEAFTQGNYLNEHPQELQNGARDYQRLEFLGDAVMQLAVADYLFVTNPDWSEGQLTEMRISMVQSKSFAHFARQANFDQYIRLGKGEENANARNRDSLLEDIFEAFIGALYMDQGMGAVQKFLKQTLFSGENDFFNQLVDYKSKLQETLQKAGAVKIEYKKIKEAETDKHNFNFTVELLVNGQKFSQGEGNSIKNAEKNAAKAALKEMGEL